MRNAWLLCATAIVVFGLAHNAAGQSKTAEPQIGFVDCPVKAESVPLFEDTCSGKRAGQIACREQVKIVARVGPFFKIWTGNAERFISAGFVSRSSDKFISLDFKGPATQLDCAVAVPTCADVAGKKPPHTVYAPDPGYPEAARRAKLTGVVVLSLTLGTDGRAHNIRVEKSLAGLDEEAIATVEKWRFVPACDDGKAVPAKIHVEVHFRNFE